MCVALSQRVCVHINNSEPNTKFLLCLCLLSVAVAVAVAVSAFSFALRHCRMLTSLQSKAATALSAPLSLSCIPLSLPPSLSLSLALPPSVFLHSPGERFGPLLHIFARALKACNVFLTLHVLPLPLPLPLRAAGAGAAALATFCLRCQHISFCARAFCCCCLLVFLSSYFPVIQLELDSISPRAESCP